MLCSPVFCHDLGYLILSLRPFSSAAEVHVGTALYVATMVMNNLKSLKAWSCSEKQVKVVLLNVFIQIP